jgi:hypothetical protein
MEDLMNMIFADESPSEISDSIKKALFSKSAEKIEVVKPYVSASMFGLDDSPEEE